MSQTQPFYFDKKFVVLSDWDGTITTCDSNDYLTDNYGMGKAGRIALNQEILEFDKSGRREGKSFRDAFELMLGSVSDNGHSLEDCKAYLTTPSAVDERRPVDFTDGFIDFKQFLDANDVPLTIVSSGMDELIRAVLTELAKGSDEHVVKDIAVVSNGVRRDPMGKWFVTWRHPERHAHDGQGPTVFFFGDGVSDLSAAEHADVLFVKVTGIPEHDNLKTHCDKAGIPYVPFRDFSAAKTIVGQIVRGERGVEAFLVGGHVGTDVDGDV